MDSVRSSILKGRFEDAIEKARATQDDIIIQQMAEILKGADISKTCPTCASEKITGIFSSFAMKLIYPQMCDSCYEKHEQEIKENEQRELEERKLKKRAYTQAHIEEILERRGVPRRYLQAMVDDFGKIKIGNTGLFLSGSRGTGKTHLACAIIRKEILENTSDNEYAMPMFVSIPDLLLEIRHSFKSDGISEKEIIDKYSIVSLLVLDDLGIEKTSEWSIQTLYTIIDKRYRDIKRTIVTSNLTLKEIAQRLDDRISSRLAGMCDIVTLKGLDKRLMEKK